MTNPAHTYRVLSLPGPLLAAMRRARDQAGITNARFLAAAVENHLPSLVGNLQQLGFDSRGRDSRTTRLPFSDEDAVIDQLREAAETVGLPMTRLLELCLVAAIQRTEKPKRGRGRRPKSDETAKTKSETPQTATLKEHVRM